LCCLDPNFKNIFYSFNCFQFIFFLFIKNKNRNRNNKKSKINKKAKNQFLGYDTFHHTISYCPSPQIGQLFLNVYVFKFIHFFVNISGIMSLIQPPIHLNLSL